MIQQQERAEKFFRAIQRDAERRRKEIIDQIDKEVAAETEKLEQAELQIANDRVKYESERIQAQTNSQLAKATTEISAELAACRSKITTEVFMQVVHRLKEFVKTPEYSTWLETGISQMEKLLGADMTIYAAADQLDQVKQCLKNIGIECAVQADEAIHLGGVRGEKGNKKIDDTLDSRLKEQADWFYQNSGLSIAIQ